MNCASPLRYGLFLVTQVNPPYPRALRLQPNMHRNTVFLGGDPADTDGPPVLWIGFAGLTVGLGYAWVLVSMEAAGTNPPWVPRDDCIYLYMQFLGDKPLGKARN